MPDRRDGSVRGGQPDGPAVRVRHVLIDGKPYVAVPVMVARAYVALGEEACEVLARAHGRGWHPKPEAVEMLRALRLAPLVVDLHEPAVSDVGSTPTTPGHAGFMTTTEIAEILDVTPRRVTQLIAAGAFPGATRVGRSWVVPADEVA